MGCLLIKMIRVFSPFLCSVDLTCLWGVSCFLLRLRHNLFELLYGLAEGTILLLRNFVLYARMYCTGTDFCVALCSYFLTHVHNFLNITPRSTIYGMFILLWRKLFLQLFECSIYCLDLFGVCRVFPQGDQICIRGFNITEVSH